MTGKALNGHPEHMRMMMSKEQPEALRPEEKWRAVSAQQAEEISRLHAENETLRAQIWQAAVVQQEPTDAQIMATVGRKGFGFSDSRPLGQQWNQVCELIRAVVRERYTHPAPQQKPLTDEQITAGAKALCKRSSEICGVNADDNWNLDSEYFKDDARCVLEAAHNIGEKK